MMKRNRRIVVFLLALFLLLPNLSLAGKVEDLLYSLAAADGPYSAEVWMTFHSCVPFSKERLEPLNNLLQHVSFQISRKENLSSVRVLIGLKEAVQWTEKTEEKTNETVFSLDPNTVWVSEGSLFAEGGSLHSSEAYMLLPTAWSPRDFLPFAPDRDHLSLPGSLHQLMEKMRELFQNEARITNKKYKMNQNVTASQKAEINLPDERLADEAIRKKILDSCENPVLSAWISSQLFSGRQRLTFFQDEENRLLKIQYNGQTGEKNNRRKITLEWLTLPDENTTTHQITMRSQPVSGYPKTAFSLTMEETQAVSEQARESLKGHWEYTLSEKGKKTKWSGEAELHLDSRLNGTIRMQKETGDQTTSLTLSPNLNIQRPESWQGTVRIKVGQNDMDTLDADVHLAVSDGADPAWGTATKQLDLKQMDEKEKDMFLQTWYRRISASVLSALLSLPEDALGFIKEGLEEDVWQTIVSSAGWM